MDIFLSPQRHNANEKEENKKTRCTQYHHDWVQESKKRCLRDSLVFFFSFCEKKKKKRDHGVVTGMSLKFTCTLSVRVFATVRLCVFVLVWTHC